jgi:hypothetical protein
MHTLSTKWNGQPAYVMHNGDWSGMARVTWFEKGQRQEVEVPGVVFVAAARNVVGDALENVKDRVDVRLAEAVERLSRASLPTVPE